MTTLHAVDPCMHHAIFGPRNMCRFKFAREAYTALFLKQSILYEINLAGNVCCPPFNLDFLLEQGSILCMAVVYFLEMILQ